MTQTKTTSSSILQKSNKRLSVQVTLTGLSFLVSDQTAGTTIFFREQTFDTSFPTPEELLIEMDRSLSTYVELQESFDEVTVIYATNVYTLVPASLFDETKASEYLKFNSKILANDFIAHDLVANHDTVVVYVPYVNINNYLFDKYGSFQYYHSVSVLLKALLDLEKYTATPKVFVHVLDGTFDLVILNKGALELCNTYSYRTPEDFIYYILFSLEQLKINPDTVDVELCGNIKESDDLYEIVYQYVRNVIFCKSLNLRIHSISDSLPHQNFLLKNIL